MKQHRPKFNSMWKHFSRVNIPVAEVGKVIGGKVEQNIQLAKTQPTLGFENACAIRLSYTFHQSGIVVNHGEWASVSGADKKRYIYRVNDLRKYLTTTFGKPDNSETLPKAKNFIGKKGIIIFTKQWGNASGHATLWDGQKCSDHCYFDESSKVEFWQLP